jgi:deoxyadenosine/deoxycytidine kinase
MKNQLTITIAGGFADGKSTLTHLLKNFLRDSGFEVEQEIDDDFLTKEVFDRIMGSHQHERQNAIKEKSKILLKEVRTRNGI